MMKSLLLDITETEIPTLPLYPEGLGCIHRTERHVSFNANRKRLRTKNDLIVADLCERKIETKLDESGTSEDGHLPHESGLATSRDRRLVGTSRYSRFTEPPTISLNKLVDCSSDNNPSHCMEIDALTEMTRKYEVDELHLVHRTSKQEAPDHESLRLCKNAATSEDKDSYDNLSNCSGSVDSSSSSSCSSSSSSSTEN